MRGASFPKLHLLKLLETLFRPSETVNLKSAVSKLPPFKRGKFGIGNSGAFDKTDFCRRCTRQRLWGFRKWWIAAGNKYDGRRTQTLLNVSEVTKQKGHFYSIRVIEASCTISATQCASIAAIRRLCSFQWRTFDFEAALYGRSFSEDLETSDEVHATCHASGHSS